MRIKKTENLKAKIEPKIEKYMSFYKLSREEVVAKKFPGWDDEANKDSYPCEAWGPYFGDKDEEGYDNDNCISLGVNCYIEKDFDKFVGDLIND